MYISNISRLWDQARKRREQAQAPFLPNTNPIWPERCVQCDGPAITKFTDMVTGEVSYWCDSDYDHWWMVKTYLTPMRAGEISSVTDLLIYPNYDDQLTGWPD